MEPIDSQVAGFILFCMQRCGKGWPDLYDEMCRVAGHGLYQGLGYKELKELGLYLGLNRVDETIKVVEAVTASQVGGESPVPCYHKFEVQPHYSPEIIPSHISPEI